MPAFGGAGQLEHVRASRLRPQHVQQRLRPREERLAFLFKFLGRGRHERFARVAETIIYAHAREG